MKVIYKYELEEVFPSSTEVFLPEDFTVLSCQAQGNHTVLWVLHEKGPPESSQRFTLVLTGQTLPSDFNGEYVDTVQLGDAFVVHCFQLGAPK